MPSHPETQDSQRGNIQRGNIERLFLGLPRDAVLPQVVGAKKQWAEQMAEKIRRASGDETIGVAMARIGNRQLEIPGPIEQPRGTVLEGQSPAEAGSSRATTMVPYPEVSYANTEPVVVVTLETSQLERLPSWVGGLDVRIVDRPEAEVIPSSYPIPFVEPDRPDRLGAPRNEGSVFEASLSSGVTLAIIAGGFGTAYYLFGQDGG
jgi:hypothetical protein